MYNEGGGSGGGGGGDSSTGSLIGEALINAIVIVCVIACVVVARRATFRCMSRASRVSQAVHRVCPVSQSQPPPPATCSAATFVLVACYYFRCLKLMLAYLIFACVPLRARSPAAGPRRGIARWRCHHAGDAGTLPPRHPRSCVNLLGYSGGFMVISAVTVYGVILDYVTLALVMANFALGGAVAVFWQKGCPRWVTQGYLVAVSVIMAWILTKLPEWTSWALLVALAVYDLVRMARRDMHGDVHVGPRGGALTPRTWYAWHSPRCG